MGLFPHGGRPSYIDAVMDDVSFDSLLLYIKRQLGHNSLEDFEYAI
jgi:hypothetical protein